MTKRRNSKRRASNNDAPEVLTPPLIALKGEQVEATYREQEVPDYRGNPLIETLPPIWTREEVEDQLMQFPLYSKKQRNLPDHIRLQLIENVREFFIPQGRHLEIETKISCMLRRGLMQRNPMNWEHWRVFDDRVDSMRPGSARKSFFRFKPRGFSIVGIGGMGKTTTVENILLMYPQVIVHTKYREQDIILKQLVWLKIDCPQDGSIKGLCINFFLAVDDILGTSYYKRYAAGRRTVDELIPHMARVASLHCLGVLVIDEIENLSEARSGGADKMLNFFVQLENNIGVPFILIGTPDAAPLLDGKFRQARRACENGDVYWERMKERVKKNDEELQAEKTQTGKEPDPGKPDRVWNEFVRALWDYQYVRNECPLADSVLEDPAAHALYDASQGITAVAATIYLLAQRRAISRHTEVIDKKVIESVAKDSQNLIGEALNQLRQGKKTVRRTKLDRQIPDLDVFNADAAGGADGPPRSARNDDERKSAADGESTPTPTAQSTDAAEPLGEAGEDVGSTPEPRKKSKRRKTKPGRDDLRNLSPCAGAGTEEAARLKAKHVKPATEFVEGGA